MAAIAGGTALGGLPVHAAQAPAGTAAPQNDLVKGYCPFCQVRCTYHARVRNGKILELIELRSIWGWRMKRNMREWVSALVPLVTVSSTARKR